MTFTTAAATSCASRRSRPSRPLVVGRTLESIAGRLRGVLVRRSSATASFAGSGPRRASSTSPPPPSSTPSGTCTPRSRASRSGSSSSTCRPRSSCRCIPFRYITDALTPDEALDILRRNEPTGPRARPRCWRRRLPGLHHLGRLARLPRRQGPSAVPRRRGRAAGALQDQGRRDLEDDIRRVAHRPRGDRRRPDPDGRRQPGLGRRAGDRLDASALAPCRPWWIEEPTSPDDILGHARIARALEPLGIGVATGEHVPQPGDVQAVPAGRGHRLLPDRQLPARRA